MLATTSMIICAIGNTTRTRCICFYFLVCNRRNELPRSKLRGIKPNTRNPNNLEQRQLDILTMQLLVNLFGSLIFDVAANRFFTPVAAHGAHEVAFGPKFATP